MPGAPLLRRSGRSRPATQPGVAHLSGGKARFRDARRVQPVLSRVVPPACARRPRERLRTASSHPQSSIETRRRSLRAPGPAPHSDPRAVLRIASPAPRRSDPTRHTSSPPPRRPGRLLQRCRLCVGSRGRLPRFLMKRFWIGPGREVRHRIDIPQKSRDYIAGVGALAELIEFRKDA